MITENANREEVLARVPQIELKYDPDPKGAAIHLHHITDVNGGVLQKRN